MCSLFFQTNPCVKPPSVGCVGFWGEMYCEPWAQMARPMYRDAISRLGYSRVVLVLPQDIHQGLMVVRLFCLLVFCVC